jgi:hypothetical protein
MITPTPSPLVLPSLSDTVTLIQCIITTFALLIGGLWTYNLFILRREKYPKAIISHNIFTSKIGRKKRLIHINVKIENIGPVLIKIKSGEIRILQILPFEWSLIKNDNLKNEISWYQLDQKLQDKNFELEPGESDELCYDSIIDENIKVIQIYCYYSNLEKGNKIGWTKTTFHILN